MNLPVFDLHCDTALEEFGPCPIHRQSFLKKFYAGK